MCTVTFLPKGKNDYILTSNRDEAPKRAAHPPKAYALAEKEIFFPKDPLAGGSWIATDKKQFTVCLLNGGFEKHRHIPPYRMSRGQMVLQFFQFEGFQHFKDRFEFQGMEPFTLVVVEAEHQGNHLDQLVWDGSQIHHSSLDPTKSFIWSSSTLYPQAVRNERRNWFDIWVEQQQVFLQSEIISFHKSGGKGDAWNDFIMNRNEVVKTVSITSIEKDSSGFHMIYEDLLREKSALSAHV